MLLDALIKELVLYNDGKYRLSQKKVAEENVVPEIIPKAGAVWTSLVHLIKLALIKKRPNN